MFSDFSCALYFWVKSHENKRCRSCYSTKHAGLSSFLMASISVAIQNLLDLRPVWHSILVGDNVHAFRRRSGTSLTMSEVFQNDIVLLVFRLFFDFLPIYRKSFYILKSSKVSKLKCTCFLQYIVCVLVPPEGTRSKKRVFSQYTYFQWFSNRNPSLCIGSRGKIKIFWIWNGKKFLNWIEKLFLNTSTMIWDLQKVLRAKGVIFAKDVKSRFCS